MFKVSFALILGLGALAGCASQNQSVSAAQPGMRAVLEIAPGIPRGYLEKAEILDSLVLLPPPPAVGSVEFEQDQKIRRESVRYRDTPRWHLAAWDADLTFPKAAESFSCAVGVAITAEDTPRLYQLLQRTMVDAGASTYSAKTHYQRPRPFMQEGGTICTPQDTDALRKDGSYPSGHTAIGWTWAVVLAEAAPERAEKIFAKGSSFGESRLICNVHWRSDVSRGQDVGAMTAARLHQKEEFREDLLQAKSEIQAARSAKHEPKRNCAVEDLLIDKTVFSLL